MFTKNRLPIYYYGDNANQDEKITKDDISLGISTVEDFYASEPNISRISSPTSSVTSTKKLEWDSGADIGYIYNSFKHTRKSRSFPSLNMDLSLSQINKSEEVQGGEMSSENKMTDDDKNFQCQSKCQDSQKKFKHSTPEQKMFTGFFKTTQQKLESKDECLQTTKVDICSKSIQTEDILNINKPKVNKAQQTDDLVQTDTSLSTNISSSKSGSFQYIPGSHYDTQTEITTSSKSPSTSKSSKTEETKKSNEKSEFSSLNSPLGKMIARQQSKHLIADIDKSLHILQNFIRSKDYNVHTKKYYAKKIINKIISHKYEDDTTVSSSSITSSSSVRKSKEESDEKEEEKTVKPVKKSCSVQCDIVPKNKFRTTATSPIRRQNITEKMKKLSTFTTEYHLKTNFPNKNWKENETLSEKLFEARKRLSQSSSHSKTNDSKTDCSKTNEDTKRTDYVIEHSRNERKRQLSWVNNEISYLQKLKGLLQNSSAISSDAENSAIKSQDSKRTYVRKPINDLENKFCQEFGPKSPDNVENIMKLSKYLSNEQIKFLIDNEAKKVHCKTCDCCKQKVEKFDETKEEILSSSYDSHNYNFYKTLMKPKNKRNETVLKKSDAGIQCTIKKKKPPQRPVYDTSSAEYSNPLEKASLQVFYDNLSNFNLSDPQSVEFFKMDQERRSNGKENRSLNHSMINRYAKQNKDRRAVAYFLTFDEETPSYLTSNTRKTLENITVKIPKMRRKRHRYSQSNSDRNETNYSLQEYLYRNRPGFIKQANWRKSVISDQTTTRRSRSIFTCSQMKELTSRHYSQLPEVKEKIKCCKILDQKQRYRCMANVYSKKLQKKTLNGQMSIATCINIMSASE